MSALTRGPDTPLPDARFYMGRRDTRWDVYPQREPLEVVAFDWYGCCLRTPEGVWFRSPVAYVLVREISKAEAEGDAA